MKAKSMKLRMLITLHALFKHTDKNHRMNCVKLNEHLRPYGLDCTSRAFGDTAAVLRDFGFDVRFTGAWKKQGLWIEDRPLPDDALKALVFAVSTNPYITSEQATELLDCLRPFVTAYQEDMLECGVETGALERCDSGVFEAYTTVAEAIRTGRRVRYTLVRVRYNKETGEVFEHKEWSTLFTPKWLYQAKGRIYMVGYNHPDRRVEAVDLREAVDIRMAFKHEDTTKAKVNAALVGVSPRDYVPEERRVLVYKGPVSFRCRGQFVGELYRMFGAPDGVVEKDPRCRCIYTLNDAEIWPETLLWLSNVPGHGIRLFGPEGAVEAVRGWFEKTSASLLDSRLPQKKIDPKQ